MHNSLPIVRQMTVTLGARTHRRLEILAKRLLAGEPTLNRMDMFGPRVRAGICEAPALFFEDHAEIPPVKEASDISLEYRSFLLGDGDDVFVVGGRRFPAFETYCHTVLGIGAGTVVEPKRAPNARFLPLSLRCAKDASSLKRLCKVAQLEGKLNLVPYIGTGNVWRLASAIGGRDLYSRAAAATDTACQR